MDLMTDLVRRLDALEKNQRRGNSQDYPFHNWYLEHSGSWTRPLTANATGYQLSGNPIGSSIYISSIVLVANVQTTNDGSNYWTAMMNRFPNSGASVAIGTVNTSAIGVAVNVPLVLTVNQSFTFAQLSSISIDWAKTGTPGNLYDNPACVWFSLV